MSIIPLPAFSDNYIWTLVDEKSHTISCVDPGDATPVLHYLKKNHLHLDTILITHHHSDHVGGIPGLLAAFPNAEVIGPYDDRIPFLSKKVKDEDIIHLGSHDFRVIHIPGHTATHICYQNVASGWLFCGDTLFSAGCGRVFDGTLKDLFKTLQFLKTLPVDTKVYCGHEYTYNNLRFALTVEPSNQTTQEYLNHLENTPRSCTLPSTIGFELKINPFLRIEEDSLKTFAQKEGINDDPYTIFAYLRNKKDHF